MRRGTLLLIVSTAGAGIAGCGGSLRRRPGQSNDAASALPDAAARDSDATAFVPDAAIRILDAARFDGSSIAQCLSDAIAERVTGTSCQFLVPDASGCQSLGARIGVFIDGVQVPQDPDNGWTYTDATEASIELHGTACELANQSATGVTIRFHIILL